MFGLFSRNVKNVNAEEAYKLINENKELYILDVRTKEEYKQGHIPGAKHIPVHVLSDNMSKLMLYKDKPILVYCASGGRSPRAIRTLVKNNFTEIYHLKRGISSWNYKIVK